MAQQCRGVALQARSVALAMGRQRPSFVRDAKRGLMGHPVRLSGSNQHQIHFPDPSQLLRDHGNLQGLAHP